MDECEHELLTALLPVRGGRTTNDIHWSARCTPPVIRGRWRRSVHVNESSWPQPLARKELVKETYWLETLPFTVSTTLPELQMLCKARPSIAQMFQADSSHETGEAALPGPGGVQKAPRVVRGGGQILKHFLYVA